MANAEEAGRKRKYPWNGNPDEENSSMAVVMVKDVDKKLEENIGNIKRTIGEIQRDLQEEQEYSRSKNLIVLGWDKVDEEQKSPPKLEENFIAFMNKHVLSAGTMTPDWISKIHYLPSRSMSTTTVTVMVQLSLAKQADLIWAKRLCLKELNAKRKTEKKPAIVLEKHHTKKFGKELRYLNRVRLDMIQNRKIQRDRVKINGARRDRPMLVFDHKAYTTETITPEVYGTVGAFGNTQADGPSTATSSGVASSGNSGGSETRKVQEDNPNSG